MRELIYQTIVDLECQLGWIKELVTLYRIYNEEKDKDLIIKSIAEINNLRNRIPVFPPYTISLSWVINELRTAKID